MAESSGESKKKGGWGEWIRDAAKVFGRWGRNDGVALGGSGPPPPGKIAGNPQGPTEVGSGLGEAPTLDTGASGGMHRPETPLPPRQP